MMEGMGIRDEVRGFLVSRRARVTPQQAGLPATNGHRRVAGLRRSEVAELTGISEDYYIRLERGDLSGVSESVLCSLADALSLDRAERSYLFDLAHAPARARTIERPVRPGIQQMVDAISSTPAFVRNNRLDLVAVNDLARVLYQPVLEAGTGNFARFCFLDPRASYLHPDWDHAASAIVAMLRSSTGQDPHGTQQLIEDLCARSPEFRDRWNRHDVQLHHSGVKDLWHPAIGRFQMAFEALPLPADPGLTLTIYSSAPGTSSAQALQALNVLAA